MSDDQADDDDEIQGEIEMIFTPRPEALASRNISADEFENALVIALEDRQALEEDEDIDEEELSSIDEMELEIGGVIYKLEELADVEIKGDLDLLS